MNEGRLTLPQIPDTLSSTQPYPHIAAWLPLLKETIQREGMVRWRVEGTSMLPTLPPDCEIDIYPHPTTVTIGDIVVFAEQDRLVVHRVVRHQGNGWVTQGDNRWAPDRFVPDAHIIGVVQHAVYQGVACYPPKYLKIIAIFWLSRYHYLRVLRWIFKLWHRGTTR